MKGIVVKNENGYFSVQTDGENIYTCKVRGKLKKTRYSLLVGDKVEVEPINSSDGFIEKIYERTNSLKRPYVANIDQVLLVVAAKEPAINTLLLNKLIVMIEDANIPLVLCINKWDLHDEETEQLINIYERIGYKTVKASTYTGEGIDTIKNLLQNKVTCFAGPSGVGKSSLLNSVEPNFAFQTGKVSEKIKRGRHTTRHASLFTLNENSFIMDTPGFSALDFTHISEERLPMLFPEFQEYIEYCKFIPCSHTHEPICGVKRALDLKEIEQSRYDAYLSILEELKG